MKKVIEKILCGILVAGILTGCSSGDRPAENAMNDNSATVTLKLGMVDPDGSNFHEGALAIADEVSKATDGKVKIEVFAGGQLGNERDMYEGAQMGTIDMFTASNAVLSAFIPEMAVLDQPFLFETEEQAHNVIDGKVGELLAAKPEEQQIHTVGWMDVGFRNVFSVRPVETVDDFEGLKIRTMENDIHIAAFNALGAIATPMASGDVFTGLQQGTIDAAENAIANLIANRYYEITKNVTMTNHVFGFMGVFVSDKAWNQIPEDLRDDFLAGVEAGAKLQRQYLVEANESAKEELTELGVQFYEIPMDEMRELVEPAMEEFADRMDPEWVEAIQGDM